MCSKDKPSSLNVILYVMVTMADFIYFECIYYIRTIAFPPKSWPHTHTQCANIVWPYITQDMEPEMVSKKCISCVLYVLTAMFNKAVIRYWVTRGQTDHWLQVHFNESPVSPKSLNNSHCMIVRTIINIFFWLAWWLLNDFGGTQSKKKSMKKKSPCQTKSEAHLCAAVSCASGTQTRCFPWKHNHSQRKGNLQESQKSRRVTGKNASQCTMKVVLEYFILPSWTLPCFCSCLEPANFLLHPWKLHLHRSNTIP